MCDSDHHPIEVWIEGGIEERNLRIEKRKSSGGRRVDEEGCRKFEQKLNRVEMGEREVEKELKMMIERLGKAIGETEKEIIMLHPPINFYRNFFYFILFYLLYLLFCKRSIIKGSVALINIRL